MKNKKSLTAVVALALLVLATACNKTANVAPQPDTEFQSSKDITYAGIVITDIDMMCSFVGEDDHYPKFYMPAAGATGTIAVNRDPNGQYLFITYNNTKCVDGRVRDGSIAMYNGNINPNAKYYRDYQFQGKIALINYRVDGWKVELKNSFIVSNKLASPAYDPKNTNLSWSLNGDFVLTDPADTNKNMHCNVDLVKTLVNTSDVHVFNPSKQATITWSLAVVNYKGTMFGETSRTKPFTYTIKDGSPLVRDFSCYPDKVSGVNVAASVTPVLDEFHPFTNGSATFVTNKLYPRDIAYGNEQGVFHDVKNAPLNLQSQCDNKGVVTIKGISYPLDFTTDDK